MTSFGVNILDHIRPKFIKILIHIILIICIPNFRCDWGVYQIMTLFLHGPLELTSDKSMVHKERIHIYLWKYTTTSQFRGQEGLELIQNSGKKKTLYKLFRGSILAKLAFMNWDNWSYGIKLWVALQFSLFSLILCLKIWMEVPKKIRRYTSIGITLCKSIWLNLLE